MKINPKSYINKVKEYFDKDKKKRILLLAVLLLIFMTLIILLVAINKKDDASYRETQVKKGKLTVGVTESGNVSIGTSEQSFDLDISEYTESSSSLLQNGAMGGGMEMMFSNLETTSQSATGRSLEIETVYVSAGEEIEEGTPLLKLTDESVSLIRQKLEEDTAEARISYEQTEAGKKQADLQAEADMDINTAYGAYAEAEYEKTVNELQDVIDDMQEQLEEAQTDLQNAEQEKEEIQNRLTEQQIVLKNAEYARDNTSRDDNLYWWIVAVNTVNDTEDIIDSLKEEVKTADEEIEQKNADIVSLSTQLALDNKALLSGKIEAEAEKEIQQFRYENSKEIYDVATAQSSFEWETAKEDYEAAQIKLDDFDSMIKNGIISSKYAGIITEVGVSEGDSLEQDDSIVTLNDYGEATIILKVDEKNMDSAEMGKAVNIICTAFPDEVFSGEVTEIGDVEINSNTNTTTCLVTVSVTGDVSGLYEGMSAEVTFITEESAEVIYVSNRAIVQDGSSAYVKIRNNKGKIMKQEVTTGFSDGVNTEIKEGLTEGDTVLIESTVK